MRVLRAHRAPHRHLHRPAYLLNVEPLMPAVDAAALGRQALPFTEAALEMREASWQGLHAHDAGVSS